MMTSEQYVQYRKRKDAEEKAALQLAVSYYERKGFYTPIAEQASVVLDEIDSLMDCFNPDDEPGLADLVLKARSAMKQVEAVAYERANDLGSL